MLAQGQRMAGNVDGAAARGRGRRPRLRGEKQRPAAVDAILFAAETAWQARRIDDARRWVERGIEAARAANASRRPREAALARRDGREPPRRVREGRGLPGRDRERWRPGRRPPRRRSRAAARSSSPCRTRSPRPSPAIYETTEEHEVLANVFETLVTTDAQGNLVPAPLRALDPRGRRRARCGCTCGRASLFSDGAPLTAAAVKASLERSIRLSRDVHARRLHGRRGSSSDFWTGRPRRSPGSRPSPRRRAPNPARPTRSRSSRRC